MRKLMCDKYKKTYSQGKFCLDCGQSLKEVVTPDVRFSKVKSSKTPTTAKIYIRKWLNRIGVQNPDIQIMSDATGARVDYVLNKKKYSFESTIQQSESNNLAAVEAFLHSRVLGIERGIESSEQAFAGYEALPDFSRGDNKNPYELLGFKEKVNIDIARSKFRELVKRFHPDVNDSVEASNQFQRLKRAMDMIEAENR